jgi:presenilin-like A22 family membrane protease
MRQMSDLKLKLFFNEVIIFLSIQSFALLCAWRIFQIPAIRVQVEAEIQPISWLYFLFAFFIATAIILFLIKFIKSKAPFKGLFYFIIFIGTFLVLDIWVGDILGLLGSLVMILLVRLVPKVIVHNIAIGLAIIGTSVLLGLSIEVWQVIIILAVLSVYDMIAVHATKHMVKMFKGLAAKGIIFAAIIPSRMADFRTELKEIKPGPGLVLLGTGDIAFPIIFATSALRLGWFSSILIIFGALCGLAFIHFRYLTQEKRQPVPALPPIAIGAICGLLISLI